MYIPFSVRGAALAILIIVSSSFIHPNVLLEGMWDCAYKSGNLDINGAYELKCVGSLQFKSNHLLLSNCNDGFFPSGARWELLNNELLLRDSDEKVFAEFQVLQLDQEALHLQRRDIVYFFKRAAD